MCPSTIAGSTVGITVVIAEVIDTRVVVTADATITGSEIDTGANVGIAGIADPGTIIQGIVITGPSTIRSITAHAITALGTASRGITITVLATMGRVITTATTIVTTACPSAGTTVI
jgi:hypothetical protein